MGGRVSHRREAWVWTAVGAVAGSLLADAWAVDQWWHGPSLGLFVVGAAGAIWLVSSREEGVSPVRERSIGLARGICLALAWAALWTSWGAALPESGTPVGELARGGSRTAVTEGRVVRVADPHRRGWILQIEPHRFDDRPVEANGWTLRVFLASPVAGESATEPPLPGDLIEGFVRLDAYPRRGFPQQSSLRRRMARRGIAGRGIIDGGLDVASPGPWMRLRWSVWRLPAAWRTNAIRAIVGELGMDRAAFPAAMVLGARGLLTDESKAGFEATGTAHLLAISGLHLGVLAVGLWWIFGWIAGLAPALLRRWGRRRVCGIAVVAALGAYVVGIGAPTSAVRAWWMVACGVVALVGLRAISPFRLLAAAVYAMLLGDPFAAGDIGFQLSVGATAAILLWVSRPPDWLATIEEGGRSRALVDSSRTLWGPWAPRLRRLVRLMLSGAGVSVVATFVTWPIIASMTGEVPLIGVVANVIVTPLASTTVIPWMFVGACASLLPGEIGWWMLRVGNRSMELLGGAMTEAGNWPGATWVTGVPSGLWTALGVIGALIFAAGRLRLRASMVGGGLLAVAIAATPLAGSTAEWLGLGPLEMHAIPVGQGDATLIVTPGGRAMLVDAGGSHFGRDPGRSVVVPYLKRLGIGELDWVVASHGDTDHIGGLTAVVETMHPHRAMLDGRDRSRHVEAWREDLKRHAVSVSPVFDSRDFRLGEASVRVMRPEPRGGSSNDHSLVVEITFGGRRLLLPGDIESRAERWLLKRDMVRRAAVLKVPHHGSKTSTTRDFLARLQPAAAVVSAGADNPFGHPHPRVMRRLRAHGVPVWQTAENGLVRVSVFRGGRLTVRVVRGDVTRRRSK